jgi:RHS repeat-associated protein
MSLLSRLLGFLLFLLRRLVALVGVRPRPAPPPAPTPTPIPIPVPVAVGPPELMAFRPLDRTGPTVPVRFVVSDPASARVDVRVEYSFAGGGFQSAAPAATSDRMTDLPAPDVEADYRFVWNAAADLGVVQGAAQLRFTPVRGGVAGQPSTVGCTLDTKAPPDPPKLPAAPPALAPRLTINAGDNQVGISGRLLADPLSVQVLDGANQPVPGVRVAWTVAAGTQAEVEADPFRSTLTNAGGLSFARVRFRPGYVGAGGVRATLVGVPDQRADFRVEARKPQIVVPTLSGIRAQFGEPFDIDVAYDADGSRATTDFAADPVQPVVLRVEATNAVLLSRELRLPSSPGASAAARVTVVPTIYEGTVRIGLVDASDATVTADVDLTVATRPVQRLVDVTLAGVVTVQQRDPVKVRLDPRSGLAQVGYPGLTLDTGFMVALTDGTTTFDLEVTAGTTGCGVSPMRRALEVVWTCSGGTLSTSPAAGAAGPLRAGLTTPVYFTPGGPGPWWVTAGIPAGTHVFDPLSLPHPYVDGTGQQRCQQEHSLQLGTTFAFPVQTPTDVQVVDPGPGTAVERVTPGDVVRVVVKGLSPVAAGTPDRVTLTTLDARARKPSAYTGPAAPVFEVTAAMTRAGTELTSDDVLPVRAEPLVTVSPGSALSVLPGGLVRVANGGLDRTLAVRPRVFDRFADAPVLEESPVGAGAAGGVGESVLLHSGEFRHSARDLDFVTRAAAFEFGRTYSSHLRTDGPLGPGWALEHFSFLDLTGPAVRWAGGDGRVWEFANDRSPPGLFLTLTRNTAIDDDRSPYELMDAHRDVVHFHWDGSLRFVRDRNGNRLRYAYDGRGRLAQITDPHGRVVAFAYWEPGDPVAKETVGRLRSVTDFEGRVVDYEYYAANDPNGPPGTLKKVSPPKATSPTLVGRQSKPDYRVSETYAYEVGPGGPLDLRLRKVFDSEDRLWLENTYTGRRVTAQKHGTGTFTFVPDAATGKLTVTDRAGNVTELVFPGSPFPDGAAPTEVKHLANRTLDPNAADRTYTLRHNRDGLRVSLTEPSGVVTEHVYDEKNPDERARGNLLAVRRRATTGEERVVSYGYENRFNFPIASIEARGHGPGGNQAMYTTRYVYDFQLPGGAERGNVVRIELPRTLNAVVVPTPTGGRQLRFIDETPTAVLEYNDFGLATREVDPQGVVTTHRYYPDRDPTEGAAAAAGGGLLASITRDGETTVTRDQHLEGIPLDPQTTTWRYDRLGDVAEIEDPRGVTTGYELDSLHRVVKVTEALRVAGGGGAPRENGYTWTEHGTIGRAVVEQPNASPAAGGAKLFVEVDYDDRGNPVARRFKLRAAQGTAPEVVLAEQVLRDDADRPKTITAADGRSSETAWDERGFLGRVTHATGALPLVHRRSPDGFVREEEGPAGERWTTHDDGWGEPDALIDPLGGVEQAYRDDGMHRTRAVFFQPVDPSQPTRTFPPPAAAKTGVFSEERVDELGRLRRRHEGLFDPAVAPGSGVRPTAPEYLGPPPAQWPPAASLGGLPDGLWGRGDGRTTTDILYDAWGLVTRVVDDELDALLLRRDAFGRPVEWSSSPGNVVTRVYKTRERTVETRVTVQSSDPARSATRTFAVLEEYDEHDTLVRVIDGEGSAFRYVPDERGLPTVMYDPMAPDGTETFNNRPITVDGEETTFEHDGVGRLTQVETKLTRKNPAGIGRVPDANTYNPGAVARRRWAYDAGGRLSGYVEMLGRIARFAYDPAGRLETVTYEGTGGATTTHRIGYAGGSVDTVTDANGTRLKFVADAKGRIVDMRWEALSANVAPEPKGYTLEYDGLDNLRIVRELRDDGAGRVVSGRAVTTVYDSVSQLRSEQQGALPAVRSEYDGVGRVVRLTYPGGAMVDYRWDRSGRLRAVVDGSVTYALEWLGLERLQSCSGGGVAWRYDYSDGGGRLLSLAVEGLAGGAVTFAVTPDRRGRVAAWTRTAGPSAEKVTWGFDSAGRLGEEVHDYAPARALGGGFAVTKLTVTRLFDGDGVVREQRQTAAGPGPPAPRTVVQEREERGRITKIGVTPLSYDRNGNLTRDDRSRTYVWDAWNRLARVEAGGQTLVSFTYDHLGRLVSRRDAAGEERFVYDGWRLIEVRRGDDVVERYVWGLPGQLLALHTGGRRYTVVPRPDGSPDCLVDDQRRIVERYDFSGFGATLALDASGQPVARPRLRLLFHFRIWDPVAELHLFGARWYSPRLEHFLSPDPLGPAEGTNHYALCRNDPINLRDPLGLGVADDVVDYFKQGAVEGGKAVGGATVGLIKIVGEGILQGTDLIGASWALASGGKPYRPLSSVGRMADEGLDQADILLAMGKGMVETPGRLWAAARRGDSFAAGEEALNLYVLGRPVIRAPVAYGANWLVRGIGGLGPRGLRWQIAIRNFQLRRLVLPRVRRIMGSRMPRRLTVEYGGNRGPGRIGNYNPDAGIVQVYEAAFTPGWADFVAMVRNAFDAENLGAAMGRYHWRTGLGTRRLLRGVPNDIEGLLHEVYHGYQYETFPQEYVSLAQEAGVRSFGPLEFSNPALQIHASFRLGGAHDFAAFAAPPRLLTPLGLVHQIPLAFAAGQPRRRRRW